jgi:hypothetical protein
MQIKARRDEIFKNYLPVSLQQCLGWVFFRLQARSWLFDSSSSGIQAFAPAGFHLQFQSGRLAMVDSVFF